MTANSAIHQVTGLILAGGRGSRMNHLDKGLQELNGKTLIDHVISRLAPQVDFIAINANRNGPTYARWGFPVWSDKDLNPDATGDAGNRSASTNEAGYRGPLAGLETGLMHCTTPYLLTVPCDSPFLPTNLAERLIASLQQQQASIAVACTVEKNQVRLQPVFCLLHVSLLNQLQSYLESGGRKMDGWFGEQKVAHVIFDDVSEFRNLNTLDDIRACTHTINN